MTDAVAIARELEQHRLAAWVGHETICGRVVRPFSLRTWTILAESKNAFVTGTIPLTGDVLQFLWLVDPAFDGLNKPDKRWLRTTAALNHKEAVEEICGYVARALADSPKGGKGGGVVIAAFVAYWVHRFAADYGWSAEQILSMPAQQLIQLERVGREARGDTSAQQTDLIRAMLKRQEAK